MVCSSTAGAAVHCSQPLHGQHWHYVGFLEAASIPNELPLITHRVYMIDANMVVPMQAEDAVQCCAVQKELLLIHQTECDGSITHELNACRLLEDAVQQCKNECHL